MAYRYTEEEFAAIQKRQTENLANFKRNSGRGLNPKALAEMQKGSDVKLDQDGAPVSEPVKAERAKPIMRRRSEVLPVPKLGALEAGVAKALAAGAKPLTAKTKPPKAAKPKMRQTVPKEEDECIWLKQWADIQKWDGRPVSDVLIHVPNGAYLGADAKTRGITMGKLKAMGVKPGCYDYLIPVPQPLSPRTAIIVPGLWLEMKRTAGGEVSQDQKDFKRLMVRLGWQCEVAKGWIQASRLIEEYLGITKPVVL